MTTAGAGQVIDRARAALGTDDERDALADVELALGKEQGDPRLWQVKGLLHRALDELAPAVEAFQRAAGLAPADPRIAAGLAHATLEAGLPAVERFDTLVALAANDEQAWLGRAAALTAEARVEEAIAALADRLAVHPLWLSAHYLIARLRWMQGDRETFTAATERAIAAAPEDGALWQHLLFILMHGEHHAAALRVVHRARAALGDSLPLAIAEAACLTELGELDAADRAYRRIPPPRDVAVALHPIRHMLRRGRPDAAAALAHTLLKRPGANALWPYLALAWRLLGDPRAAWLEGDGRLVGIHDLPFAPGELARLAGVLRGIHVTGQQPLEQSLRGGTQTDGPLLSRIEPEIRALRAKIVAAVEAYRAQLPPQDAAHPMLAQRRDRRVRFAGSWSVRLLSEGYHASHIHPAGWMSSALYVSLPEGVGEGADQAGWLSLGEPQPSLGINLAPMRRIAPKPGRLVLFPATTWHGTVPFAAGERLTVAFDIAPPGAS